MRKFLLLFTFIISACSTNQESIREVNLYSQRHYAVDELQYKNFTEKTGIKVNVVKANADQLIERLKNEGDNSPADLFVTVDAGKLYNAREAGVLQKIESQNIFKESGCFGTHDKIKISLEGIKYNFYSKSDHLLTIY